MSNEHIQVKDYPYPGNLAQMCSGLIAEKRALGFIYNTEAERMWEFSRFTEKFGIPQNTLTEEVVVEWLKKRPNESDSNRYSRLTLVRSLAEYMRRFGYEAFIPSGDAVGKIRRSFVPHIFTHDEIHRIFFAADKMTKAHCTTSPRRHIVMPVLLRILYCCGLRVSEVTGLRGIDVDFKNALLTVHNSKFTKSRYVPMSEDIVHICVEYSKTRHVAPNSEDWFFAGPKGTRYSNQAVYQAFRECLLSAGIPHIGGHKGPRLHDFRHTFAVHCLEKMISEGKDLTAVLPKLSSYLGHVGIESSEYYLRMTAEVYPHISELLNEKLGYIVPMEGFCNEND